MKKVTLRFYFSVIVLVCISILAVLSFIIVFADFTNMINTTIDTKSLAIFDVVFWLLGYVWSPIVRDCYDEYIENK